MLILVAGILDGCPPTPRACEKNDDCPSGDACVQSADGSLQCRAISGAGEGEGVAGEGEGVVGEGEGEGVAGEGEGEGAPGPLRHVPGSFVSTASTTTSASFTLTGSFVRADAVIRSTSPSFTLETTR